MGIFNNKAQPAEIVKVKYLGVRQGKETKVVSTVNFPMYSFLIEYSDGHREIKEYSMDSKKDVAAMNDILMYIDM